MENIVHTIGAYRELLEKKGLLTGPEPEGLDREAPVALVSYDSREVVPGTLFICKGAHFKESFLRSAREKGAVAYVSEIPYPGVPLPCIRVTDMRRAIAPLADLFYNHPSGELTVLGLTGTKGKSTTAYYLKNILDRWMADQGKKDTGLVSSIRTYDGQEDFTSHMTTPEPLDLQRHFRNAIGCGMEYLTMEVSSQALKYHRSLCTDFAVACFLNIGLDHISPIEHPNFEDYFSSKLKIFSQGKINCVNLDCDHADRILAAAQLAGRPILTFSHENPEADVYADRIRKAGSDILFRVRTRRFVREFRLTMPGLFNVENALAAITVCQALDVPQQFVYEGIAQARVPGRMEVYTNGDGSVISIVDFAHNGMSLETLLKSARSEYPRHQLVTVFGCPGNKALDRRESMGDIAGRYAHRVILTEDDPNEEDPLAICREIEPHVRKNCANCTIMVNRSEAIRRAILDSDGPTVVIVAGKGPDVTMKRRGRDEPMASDGENSVAFLREYDVRHGLDGDSKVKNLLSLLPALTGLRGRTLVAEGPFSESLLEDVDALTRLGVKAVLKCGERDRALAWFAAHQRTAALVPAEKPEELLRVMSVSAIPMLPEDADAAAAAARLKADCYVRLLPAGVLPEGDGQEPVDCRRAQELMSSAEPALKEALADAVRAVETGAKKTALTDGRREHGLLLYLLEQRIGGVTVTR